jgi:glycosyltransferase involved in cell wall biosynthesis
MTVIDAVRGKATAHNSLAGVRVLAALNGLELFGHERGNIEVLKTLRHSGAEVVVGVNAREGGGAVTAELTHLRFETFELPFNPQWSLRFLLEHPSLVITNPLAVWRCSRRFRRMIAAFQPTHIHIGSPLVYSYLSFALAAMPIPVVYRMGDCPPVSSRFNLAIWRLAVRRAARVVAVTEFVRQSGIKAGIAERKIETIYNVAPTASREDRESSMTAHGADRACRLVYVGAVAEHKGLIPLVEAVEALVVSGLPVHLDIVGGSRWDSAFRSRLVQFIAERGVADRIVLHGHVDDPSPFYARADVHLAPSIWDEPIGNVVIEAKREGTPSVVFPSGGLTEMVHHKVDGYICDDRSAGALIEALRWMFDDRSRLDRMRVAARADHDTRFDQVRFGTRWASVYNALRVPSDER